MQDQLGDRMKRSYEDATRISLPRRSYLIIRVDGKAFHTYTKGLKRPFDAGLIEDMNYTAAALCKGIEGAKMAFVQSDEISILVTDFDTITTQAWYDNNLQKMCSISASIATSEFNFMRMQRYFCGPENNVVPDQNEWWNVGEKYISGTNLEQVHDDIASLVNYMPSKRVLAQFDARVFQIPSRTEVINYFIWRQQDATRNSISSVAQSLYSHKELEGKNGAEKQEMIFQKGINWNDYSFREKRGGVIEKVYYMNKQKIDLIVTEEFGMYYTPYGHEIEAERVPEGATIRSNWELVETPIFTQDKNFLGRRVPLHF